MKTEKNGFCKITHKKGWLEFLEDGDLVFTPIELHTTLRTIISMDDKQPRGKKLFHLRRKGGFTLKENKEPYRPEEALERFLVYSNESNFYNQIPIGGGKESIDIGIDENNSNFMFVELKPWSSNNSPLYAIVESLKNLTEYRIIHEKKIKTIALYKDIALCILAPIAYYQKYGLVDYSGNVRKIEISYFQALLNSIEVEFNSKICVMSLDIAYDYFKIICSDIYDKYKLNGQDTAVINYSDAILDLVRDKWSLIAESHNR